MLVASMLARAAAPAAGLQKWYYIGDVKLSSSSVEPRGAEVILIEKTHDPDRGLIIERAIEIKPDHTVRNYTMNLKVTGNSFTVIDAQHTIQGSERRSKTKLHSWPNVLAAGGQFAIPAPRSWSTWMPNCPTPTVGKKTACR